MSFLWDQGLSDFFGEGLGFKVFGWANCIKFWDSARQRLTKSPGMRKFFGKGSVEKGFGFWGLGSTAHGLAFMV